MRLARSLSLTALLSLSFCLAACGGGGTGASSSGTGSSNPGTPPPPPVPQSAPNMPVARYKGATQQVLASSASAVSLTQSALNALNACIQAAEFFPAEPDFINPVYKQLDSNEWGDAAIEGRLARNGTGWFTFQYQQYRTGGATINGTLIVQVSHVRDGSVYDATIGYSNVELEQAGRALVLNGVVEVKGLDVNFFGVSADNMLVNLTAQDKIAGYNFYLSNVSMAYSATVADDAPKLTNISGTIYDSTQGFFSLSAPGTMAFFMASPDKIAVYRGGLAISGSGSGQVQFNSLNDYIAYIGVDPSGSGALQQTARFDLLSSGLDTFTDVLGRKRPVAEIDQVTAAARST
jgi:hypothetical protein